MRNSTFIKSFLLLCALIVGAGTSWAETKTSTLSFTAACGGSGTADDGVVWTVTSDADESNFDTDRGIHYGTGKKSVSYIELTTEGFTTGAITKVVVNASGNNSPSLSVTIGGSAFGTTATGVTTSNKEYTFNGYAEAGKIVVRLAKTQQANGALYIKSVAVTYDEGPTKANNDLAWSAASKDVVYSETPYNLPTLSNPHNLAVTYDSSNKAVATIDTEGNVTIKNTTGSTTISATTEGDDTYKAGTVSYELNVTKKVVIEDGVFNFDLGSDYGSGVTQSTNITEGETSTWTSGNIVMTAANRYAWYDDGTLRIYRATSSYEAGKITITCPAGNIISKIEFTGVTGTGALSNVKSNKGDYNVSGETATWTGAAPDVTFTASNSTYIKTITVTYGNKVPATVTSAGWATWVAPIDVTVPSGVEAYAVALNGNKTSLTALTAIPTGTPVLLKNEGTFQFPLATTTPAAVTTALKVSDGTGAANAYVLAKPDGKSVGFYKWTEAQALPAGKVYLVYSGTSAPDFIGLNGDATGIEDAVKSEEISDKSYYNLNGQRVAQPTKGLYIVNGKKIVIK